MFFRYRITSKDAIASIQEYSECALTVRGTYYPPNKNPPEGMRKVDLVEFKQFKLLIFKLLIFKQFKLLIFPFMKYHVVIYSKMCLLFVLPHVNSLGTITFYRKY